jgi:hypothetical protein
MYVCILQYLKDVSQLHDMWNYDIIMA